MFAVATGSIFGRFSPGILPACERLKWDSPLLGNEAVQKIVQPLGRELHSFGPGDALAL
jgi:hypothetical protein